MVSVRRIILQTRTLQNERESTEGGIWHKTVKSRLQQRKQRMSLIKKEGVIVKWNKVDACSHNGWMESKSHYHRMFWH